jgi:DNA-binding transcriptional ArsR family regulator
MVSSREDEIYSIMFSSLKHPVRRKILRMLGSKPMTFMEMVDKLGVSTPHLGYHLENLGELVSKMEDGQYRLSSFGLATVNAMKDVEEVKEIEPKHRQAAKWKMVSVVLLAAILLLSGMAVLQYYSINQLSNSQLSLLAENQQLKNSGFGEPKAANFLQNVTRIDTTNYTISILSNTMQWRSDLGGVPEESIKYSFKSTSNNLDINFQFRNNHFTQFELHGIDMFASTPFFTRPQPNDVLQNAKAILARYAAFTGDAYLTNMSDLLSTVNTLNNTVVTQSKIKLQITVSQGTVGFLWSYSENGIDFQAKGLQMTFQDNVLTAMTDGYFLYNVGNTNLATSQEQAVNIVKNYMKTLTWTIGGEQISGFNVKDTPISVQLVPHLRGDSVLLFPYWYVEMNLDQTYSGGINVVAIGLFADTGQVADVQMLSSTT